MYTYGIDNKKTLTHLVKSILTLQTDASIFFICVDWVI